MNNIDTKLNSSYSRKLAYTNCACHMNNMNTELNSRRNGNMNTNFLHEGNAGTNTNTNTNIIQDNSVNTQLQKITIDQFLEDLDKEYGANTFTKYLDAFKE